MSCQFWICCAFCPLWEATFRISAEEYVTLTEPFALLQFAHCFVVALFPSNRLAFYDILSASNVRGTGTSTHLWSNNLLCHTQRTCEIVLLAPF